MLKKFIIKNLIFSFPFVVCYFLTQFFYSPNQGDLVRVGYLTKDDKYRELFEKEFQRDIYFSDINSLDTTKQNQFTALTIGDSFSEQGSYGYKNFIAESDSISVLHFNRIGVGSNPIESVYGLLNGNFFDKIKVEFIILQSIEREFVRRSQFLNKSKVLNFGDIVLREKSSEVFESNTFSRFIPSSNFYKYPLFSILYRWDDNAFYSDVYKLNLTKPLFTNREHDALLVFSQDLNLRDLNNKTEDIARLNLELNSLSALLKERGISLIVLPSPDKYSIYYEFIKNKEEYPKPLFFNSFDNLEKDYIYINSYRILFDTVLDGNKDIYFADDTHWSPMGSKLIANKIREEIFVAQSSQPKDQKEVETK